MTQRNHVITALKTFFMRIIQIMHKASRDVQNTPNTVKIHVRYLYHLTTTIAAITSLRHAVITAPLRESTWLCRWQPRSLRARAREDRRPGDKVIAIELFNRSESHSTCKCIDNTRSTSTREQRSYDSLGPYAMPSARSPWTRWTRRNGNIILVPRCVAIPNISSLLVDQTLAWGTSYSAERRSEVLTPSHRWRNTHRRRWPIGDRWRWKVSRVFLRR
jgi:hypothetical protein